MLYRMTDGVYRVIVEGRVSYKQVIDGKEKPVNDAACEAHWDGDWRLLEGVCLTNMLMHFEPDLCDFWAKKADRLPDASVEVLIGQL